MHECEEDARADLDRSSYHLLELALEPPLDHGFTHILRDKNVSHEGVKTKNQYGIDKYRLVSGMHELVLEQLGTNVAELGLLIGNRVSKSIESVCCAHHLLTAAHELEQYELMQWKCMDYLGDIVLHDLLVHFESDLQVQRTVLNLTKNEKVNILHRRAKRSTKRDGGDLADVLCLCLFLLDCLLLLQPLPLFSQQFELLLNWKYN